MMETKIEMQYLNPYNVANQQKMEIGLVKKHPCSPQECQALINALSTGGTIPTGVYHDSITGEFYRISEIAFSEEQKREYLQLQQLKELKSIRKSMSFFVFLTCISLALSLISFISIIDAFS